MRSLVIVAILAAGSVSAEQVRVRMGGSVLSLPMEEYLKGVVPHEMPSGWPLEALKAQAVAARSFAYHRLRQRQTRAFDLEAGILDQQFDITSPIRKIDQAVEATRDLVLVDKSGEVFEAFYHADCGGQTEVEANVWGGESLNASRVDCAHPTRHWDVDFSRTDLLQLLLKHFDLPKATPLKSLQAVGHSASGRVKQVRVDFGSDRTFLISSQEFRQLVGFHRLPSTNFQVRWIGPWLHVTGVGQGHGVGLCQYGARALASQGASFREILRFYYPRAHLSNVGEAKLASAKL